MKLLSACLLLTATACFGRMHSAADSSQKTYDAAIDACEKAGRLLDAERTARKLVNERTQTLGAEDKRTLRARMALIRAILMRMNFAEAEPLLEKLIPVVARVCGPGHPFTIICHSYHIVVVSSHGRDAEVAEMYRKALPDADRILGPADKVTLRMRRNFIIILDRLGKLAEAEALRGPSCRR
jgi:hypothetical protein